MIPTVGPHVRVSTLDPVFAARLDAFLNDRRFGGHLKVYSGVRSYEQQRYLWDGWNRRLPGFNLAANPDSPMTVRYGLPTARGSWHMEQAGRGFAVDLNFSSFCWLYFGLDPGQWSTRQRVNAHIEPIAADYRLVRTVPSEEWHYQMTWHDWTWAPTHHPTPDTHPISLDPKEHPMGFLVRRTDGALLHITAAGVVRIKEAGLYPKLVAAGVPLINNLTHAEFAHYEKL